MPAKYYGRYLGLGRRYEVGICFIVISVNEHSNDVCDF